MRCLRGGEGSVEEHTDGLIIRRARSDEAEAIWRLTRLAYAPYRGKIRPTFGALKVRLSTVRREIRTRSRIYGVGLLNGRIVATIRYRKRPRYLGLSRLAVHPDYQARGIGTAMLRWAEGEALRCGVRELRGDVRAAMPHLLDFYRRLGYRPFARRSKRGYPGYLIAVKKKLRVGEDDAVPPG